MLLLFRSVPPSSGVHCSSRSWFGSHVSLQESAWLDTGRSPLRCSPANVPPPRLPHSLDVLLQMSPLRHPSFRCPPSDIFLQMSLPQNSSLRGLSADVPPLRHPSFSCPSLKCAPPEVLPQRSPLRPLPSDVFPTDSLPEMSSLRSPPLNVVSTDVLLRHPLPLDICPQTSSFRGILSCPSSSQCPSV